jgi:hypothetical protein
MYYWGCSSAGRATGLQPVGSGFESCHLHQVFAGLAQLVERNFAKVKVVSSNLISRSSIMLGSSIGLGHRPFTAGRGVRFPYRVPKFGSVPESGLSEQS